MTLSAKEQMNYLKAIVAGVTSSFFLMNISMDRPSKRPRDDYQEELAIKKNHIKKEFNLHPSLIQHGAYLATVKNYSGQELRIAAVPLRPKKTHNVSNCAFDRYNDTSYDNDYIEFFTNEDNAEDICLVAKNQHVSSNRLFVAPKTVSNDISTAEGFCLLVEAKEKPETRKLLLILRAIDDEERTCQATSYFYHEPNKKSYTKGVKKYYDNSKVITLINLVVEDSQLQNIKAFTRTFAVSPS